MHEALGCLFEQLILLSQDAFFAKAAVTFKAYKDGFGSKTSEKKGRHSSNSDALHHQTRQLNLSLPQTRDTSM